MLANTRRRISAILLRYTLLKILFIKTQNFTLQINIMALPPHFKGSAQYFEEILKMFYKYEHLFNFPNTDVLINNTFDHIDIELENIDVFNESFEIFALKSKYLQAFFDNYEKFKPIMEQFRDEELDFLIDAPLSCKKKHEISYLAKEIAALCEEVNCDTVVDFGSGLVSLMHTIVF